jgi:nitrogenase-stabilizing/protective protein
MSAILEQLGRISAAEEFFALLDVPYDPKVLDVARLHILRRMRDHLAKAGADALPEVEARAAVRAALSYAYADFVASAPLEQRIFKVLQEAVRPPSRAGFVPLSAVTGA